jgi:sigma-B regulation protein RsbU (phosphoserine phosphatase)
MGERAGDPAQVLIEINRGLRPIIEQTQEMVFATAFYGVIDTESGTLAYANAGHPAPLIRRAGATVESLSSSNPEPAAGLIGDFPYTSAKASFAAGDCLLLFTDGVFEANNAAGEMYGTARLAEFVGRKAAPTGTALIEALIDEVRSFAGRSEFDDDICIFTVESTGTVCALRPAMTYEI